MKKLSVEQLKELLEFHYEYDDLVTVRNHIEYVIENTDNGKYDNVSHESIYEQEMDNMNVESWLNEIDDVDKFVDDLIRVNDESLSNDCVTVESWNLENYHSHINFLNNLERVNDYCKQNNITIEQYLQGEWKYKQEMDNMKFCGCGCTITDNEYQCDDCKGKQ